MSVPRGKDSCLRCCIGGEVMIGGLLGRSRSTESRILSGSAILSCALCVGIWSHAAFADTIETVTVTAQKRDESALKVPISLTVVSGDLIDKVPVGGASDILSRLPGIAIYQYPVGGGSQVTIRGVTAAGAFAEGASPNAYYLDGVPFSLINSAVVPDSDIYDLQRIEVLRGPQGTLYGASALNGVVRVLTNDADLNDFDIKGRFSDSFTEGGGNNYHGNLTVNIPIDPGVLAVRATVGYENDSGWIDSAVQNHTNTANLHTY